MTKAKIDADLKDHLLLNKQIANVYFNKKGEWIFHARKQYPIEVPREEILADEWYPEFGMEKEVAGSTAEKKLTIKDVIAKIDAAETTDELDEIMAGETRLPIIKAASARVKAIEDAMAE